MMKVFKGQHSIISYKSFVNKSTLVLIDEVRKNGFHYIGYGFCYNFHDNITEGYGSIINGFGRVMLFRDEGNKGLVKSLGALLVVEKFENVLSDILSHYLPICMVESIWHTIRTRGIIPLKLVNIKDNLLSSEM